MRSVFVLPLSGPVRETDGSLLSATNGVKETCPMKSSSSLLESGASADWQKPPKKRTTNGSWSLEHQLST